MRSKKIGVGIILIFIIGIIVFFKEKDLLNGYFSSVKLQVLTKCIDENYLDVMNLEEMTEGIYYGYLNALDNEDTYYLNKDELKTAQIEAKGDLFAIGLILQWSLDEQYLIVVEVIPGSPAEKAGIEVGDCITKLNNTPVVSMSNNELSKIIYSSGKEPITCEVKGKSESMIVTLAAEEIILEEFDVGFIDDILYVDFETIKEGTSYKLEQILDAYHSQIKGLILDIRDLDTDHIEEIRRISDLFLDKEIAFKVQSKKEGMVSFETEDGSYDMKIVLITNKHTKGGAEALVLALQERAIQLGGNTGGDAYIKKLITFEDETGMWVAAGTINNRYGEKLSKAGIEPDVRLYITEEEKLLMLEQGHISEEDDIYFQQALKQFQ